MTDNRKLEGPVKFDFDFDEALERVAGTDPKEVVEVQKEDVPNATIDSLIEAFEAAGNRTDDGNEFWYARDLQILLEYRRWESFEDVLERAVTACREAGQEPGNHFRQVPKMVPVGSGAEREILDVMMDRYACYLVAQNGDSKKRAIAFAQTYFAIQTRRQEIADQTATVAIPLSEDEKRIFLRNQIKEHNRYLSSAAKDAGVVTPQDFAIFHSKGYQGLYGKTVGQIRQYKGLSSSTDILNRMGSTELAANFFRVTQTEEKLRKDGIRGKERANETHYAVGRQVRDAMLKISGIAPEDLPAVDDIKHVAKRLMAQPAAPVIAPAARQVQPAADKPVDDLRPINLRNDLWKYALLVLAQRPAVPMSTTELIAELPNYIVVPDDAVGENASRKDSKFSQLVRNLKSHKTTKTNFIYQGYAEDVQGGFQITNKGMDFVREYFKN